jgi:hypothetical protein
MRHIAKITISTLNARKDRFITSSNTTLNKQINITTVFMALDLIVNIDLTGFFKMQHSITIYAGIIGCNFSLAGFRREAFMHSISSREIHLLSSFTE